MPWARPKKKKKKKEKKGFTKTKKQCDSKPTLLTKKKKKEERKEGLTALNSIVLATHLYYQKKNDIHLKKKKMVLVNACPNVNVKSRAEQKHTYIK